jgi:hypothetical protein
MVGPSNHFLGSERGHPNLRICMQDWSTGQQHKSIFTTRLPAIGKAGKLETQRHRGDHANVAFISLPRVHGIKINATVSRRNSWRKRSPGLAVFLAHVGIPFIGGNSLSPRVVLRSLQHTAPPPLYLSSRGVLCVFRERYSASGKTRNIICLGRHKNLGGVGSVPR